jgi:hypothetical protein
MIDDYKCGPFDGMKLGGETEVLGGHLSQYFFVHHKVHMT